MRAVRKVYDTVVELVFDKINSIKTPQFADSFLVFINDFELDNSIVYLLRRLFDLINERALPAIFRFLL